MHTDQAPLSAPVAEHRFACAKCDQEAGLVQLFERPEGGVIIRLSFTSRLTLGVPQDASARVRDMILAGDVQALYEFDLEVASFYCPRCHACYCGNHWVRWDVFEDDAGITWHDSIRGCCPLGHERMLED